MTTIYPQRPKHASGAWVQTSTRRVGRIVSAHQGPEAQHDDLEWCEDSDRWVTCSDEYLENVYQVQFLDTWGEPYTEPWPEHLLDPVSVLDALIE